MKYKLRIVALGHAVLHPDAQQNWRMCPVEPDVWEDCS